jgi:hypothetical protein
MSPYHFIGYWGDKKKKSSRKSAEEQRKKGSEKSLFGILFMLDVSLYHQ